MIRVGALTLDIRIPNTGGLFLIVSTADLPPHPTLTLDGSIAVGMLL